MSNLKERLARKSYSEQKLRKLSTYLPLFTHEDCYLGEWIGKRYADCDNTGNFVLHPVTVDFLNLCKVDGWLLLGFDWYAWSKSEEGQHYLDADNLNEAEPIHLARVITVIWGRQHADAGSIECDHGLLIAVLHRAKELSKHAPF